MGGVPPYGDGSKTLGHPGNIFFIFSKPLKNDYEQ